MQIELTLPWPPSVNSIWRQGRRHVYRDPKYLSWIKESHGEWLIQRGKIRSIKGEFRLEIALYPPDKRLRDIDNLPKCLLDFLQNAGIIENDHFCRSLLVEYGKEEHTTASARLTVTSW